MILMGIIDEWDFWCPEFWHPPENNNCCNNLFGRQIFPNCIVLNDRFFCGIYRGFIIGKSEKALLVLYLMLLHVVRNLLS